MYSNTTIYIIIYYYTQTRRSFTAPVVTVARLCKLFKVEKYFLNDKAAIAVHSLKSRQPRFLGRFA